MVNIIYEFAKNGIALTKHFTDMREFLKEVVRHYNNPQYTIACASINGKIYPQTEILKLCVQAGMM